MAEDSDETQAVHASAPVTQSTPTAANQHLRGMQAVNEQLLLAGLREQTAAEQLRGQLAFTTLVTSNLAEGVLVINITGPCPFTNPAAEHLLGWTKQHSWSSMCR